MAAALLSMTAVSFAYGDRPVLDDVSLSLTPGTVVGVLGPNGAGKSTLIRLAAGLVTPRSGQVLLRGQPLSTLGRAAIARQVALVPQGSPLPPAFTGWEIARMGRTPHLGWLGGDGPADAAVVRRALSLADADYLAQRRVAEMSGGERQRLLLARALAQEPAVLLLDEPTVYLDLAHQLALVERVAMLARDTGLAALAVFHDLNLAATACDQLIVLAGGRVHATGTPAAVLTPPLLHRVFGVVLRVAQHPEDQRPVILLPAPERAASPGRADADLNQLTLLHAPDEVAR